MYTNPETALVLIRTPPFPADMPVLQTPSGAINYYLEGPPDAPVLLLSNSLGADHTMWNAQLPAFAANYRVLRYDTRGHGLSEAPNGPYTIELLGRDVLALLDWLHIDKVSFCGLSMGGLIGQWLGINAPTRLHKLVLCNTAAKIGSTEGWNARIGQMWQQGIRPLGAIVVERWFTTDFQRAHPAEVARVVKAFRQTPPAGYAACCAAVRDADFRAEADAISTPTLVIAGTADAATTVAETTALQQAIPNAKLVVLEAAHLSNIEAPEPFTVAVLEFLAA